jgi:uncharacterized protein YciI
MPIFAVTYHYVSDPAVIDAHRPIHREYLRSLLDGGGLLAAGPTLGRATPSAQLIFEAESAEAVDTLLDADPFVKEGVVTSREIYEWTVAIGSVGGGSGH